MAPYPYPYPYAYPAYPAPPPPPGYPYGYYYAAPEPPKLRYPDNSAVSSTPFIDALVLSASWENRFSNFLNVGAQAGVFVAERLRLTVRAVLPSNNLNDEYYYDTSYTGTATRSKDASFLYGASAGVVLVGTKTFAFSPGLAFSRSDVSDYGTMVGLSMPLEWVLPSGLRLGLEVDLGRAFGGQVNRLNCANSVCVQQTADRPAGTGFGIQFELGYGFNHPAPLPPVSPAPR